MISLYVGTTGAGKTHLATRMVAARSAELGRPVILLDMEGVTQIEGAQTVPHWDALFRLYYVEELSVRWVPPDEDEVSKFAAGLAAGQRAGTRQAILLIEEGVHCTRYDRITDEIRRLFRMHRHLKLDVHVTTQYVGDFSPLVLQCADSVYAFNCPSRRAQDRLDQEYGLSGLEALSVGEYREWHKGLGLKVNA